MINITLLLVLIIILIICLVLLFGRLTIKLVKNQEMNVDLLLGGLTGYRIDLDELIREVAPHNVKQVPLATRRTLEFLEEYFPFILELMNVSHLKKVTVIPKWNIRDTTNNYLAFSTIMGLCSLQNFFDRHFQSTSDEYYQIVLDYLNQGGIMIEMIVQIRYIKLISFYIKNRHKLRPLLRKE